MPREDFDRFRQLVLADPDLQKMLQAEPDMGRFVALARRLGAERGCHFEPEDVRTATQAAWRQWLERWI